MKGQKDAPSKMLKKQKLLKMVRLHNQAGNNFGKRISKPIFDTCVQFL